jgi:micrococcal nuclease
MEKLALDARGVGRVVNVITDPTQGKLDRYGRLLAYVRVAATGRDLGAAQITAGWSATYTFNKPFAKTRIYQADEQQAKARGAGVWRACGGNFHSAQ